MHAIIFYSALLLIGALITPSAAYAQTSSTDGSVRASLLAAHAHSPVLKAARLEIDAAKESRIQALAGWKPTLNAQASIFTTDIKSGNFSQGTGATTKDASLMLDQPLYRGGRTVAETSRAGVIQKMADEELRRNVNIILLQTAQAHIDMSRNALLLKNAHNGMARAMAEQKATQARMEAGEMTQTDVSQADARYSRTSAIATAREGALSRSQARYARLTGSAAPGYLPFPEMPAGLPASLDAALSAAILSSPEVAQAKLSRDAALLDIDITASDLRPRLNAYASMIKQYDPQPGIISDAEEKQVGLRAALPIYEGGLIRSRVRESRIRANQQEFTIADTEDDVSEQVMSAWISLETSRTASLTRYTELVAAQNVLNGIQTEMQMGERSLLDVMDAQEKLSESEDAYILSRCDEVANAYSLLASMGTLDPDVTP